MGETKSFRIAVDIGGTFTDTVLISGQRTILSTAKTATTPENPTLAALEGVRLVTESTGIPLYKIKSFIHGTTLATNALIERRGADVGTITTSGFRDILEIAYERRYSQYEINIDKPDLIVPRERCFTISERMSVQGDILEPLDESAAGALIDMFRRAGVEAVAICLLHAYANPLHEQRLREILLEKMPKLVVSLSSEVSPEAREFDRLCTTIANAYIQPLMSEYLEDFVQCLAAEGLSCPILMMTAGGGMTTLETAAKYPIRLVESGPAGGAILAAQVAACTGLNQVVSFDMGGTTAKLCMIDNFQPQTARSFEIARAERFIKGSGMPVRIPVVEMIEIGAGGGSIATIDSLGRLTVGPRSAGSEPGPAAFGRGGTEATVTDADVMQGYIDPEAFAEGRLTIDKEAAKTALEKNLSSKLGFDALHSAEGVSQIVDENMANAGRMHAVESGKDLDNRTLISFGGNGPLHATRVARKAGIKHVLIPNDPGVGSAVGFLFAPVSFELVRTYYSILDQIDIGHLNRFFAAMIHEAETVVRAGRSDDDLLYQRTAFMRYHGQGHEIEIDLPNRDLVDEDIAHLRQAFEKEYSSQFSRTVPGMAIEILNWSVRVSSRPAPISPTGAVPRRRKIKPQQRCTVLCDVTGDEVEAGVYKRSVLEPGDTLSGPALILEPQTTTLVSVDFTAFVDADGNLHLNRVFTGEASASQRSK